MPEGDTLHRAAARLQVLVGDRVHVETPHPRVAGKRLAERLDGRRLEAVEAVGKNLLLRFESGLVLRSHLRMSGRWRVEPIGARRVGRPWLVLRGSAHEAVLWNGPQLELVAAQEATRRLGPDILASPPDYDEMVARLRTDQQGREIGEALLDQRLVSGIGNLWRAESLWEARLSPWLPLERVDDAQLQAVLEAANRLMRAGVEGARPLRHVYRRAGRPCRRCGATIESRPQGDRARTAYWCPGCQRG